jgi:aldehyde dehydrogenase (NAD+)
MAYEADLNFVFHFTTRIVYGIGTVNDVALEVGALGCKRPVIVTDPVLASKTDLVDRVRKALGSLHVGTFSDVEPDSGVHVVNNGAAYATGVGADCLVSVGGGSVIDTAKGMAIVMKEGGSLMDYEGFQRLSRAQTPHVVIPTTAGTGSEVTYAAVIKDHERKQKLLFGDNHIIPNTAILDPKLTEKLPKLLTAATGMDALSHCLEAIHSQQAEPLADGLALHGLRLIREYLPRAVDDGADMLARGMMLQAATLGGAAFSNAQVGIVHAIAHTIGARHGVHHGTANALLMPACIRFNNSECAERYALVAEALGVDTRGMAPDAAGLAAADAITRLNERIGLPLRLRDVNVPESDLEKIAEVALSDGAIVYNPRIVTEVAEVMQILRDAY